VDGFTCSYLFSEGLAPQRQSLWTFLKGGWIYFFLSFLLGLAPPFLKVDLGVLSGLSSKLAKNF
jgi:hypothetical protein